MWMDHQSLLFCSFFFILTESGALICGLVMNEVFCSYKVHVALKQPSPYHFWIFFSLINLTITF